MNSFTEHNFLAHYGILGMKWGIRRYQNPDGSLTSEGRVRYGNIHNLAKHIQSENAKASRLAGQAAIADRAYTRTSKAFNKKYSKYLDREEKYGPNSKRTIRAKAEAAEEGFANMDALANKREKRAAIDKHYNQLIKEFGEERVGNVVYNKKGEISDGVKKGDIIVSSALLGGVGTTSLAALALSFDKDPVFAKTGVRTAGKTLSKSYQKQVKENVSKVKKEAPNRIVDDNYELLKGDTALTKEKIKKSMKLDTIEYLKNIGEATYNTKGDIDWAIPVVTFDPKTGKIIRTRIDT